MKRLKRKILIPFILMGALAIAVPTSIYAKTHYFTYEVGVALRGKTQYSLSKANTSVYSTANTRYRYDNSISKNKLSYRYELGRYKANAVANGKCYRMNCGRISAGKYNISVYVTSDNYGQGRVVKGSGRIVQ